MVNKIVRAVLSSIVLVIVPFGAIGNGICFVVLLKKAISSSKGGFFCQLFLVLNDTLCSLSTLFYYIIASIPKRRYSYILQSIYVYSGPISNIFFVVSPFLMLNNCIERNIAVYAPYFYSKVSHKRLLVCAIVIAEYVLSTAVNLTDMIGWKIVPYNSTYEHRQYRTNVNKEITLVGWISEEFIFLPTTLLLILILNITFIRKYHEIQKSQYFSMRRNCEQIINERLLAAILIAQSVLVALPQVAMFINQLIVLNSDCNGICYTVRGIIENGGDILMFLLQSSNLLIYCFFSKFFRNQVSSIIFSNCRNK